MKESYKTISALKAECTYFAERVLSLDYSDLNDDALKTEIANCDNEIFLAAMITEVIKRTFGISLFKCQLETTAALLNGHIAELPTGEGKTLSAVVAAIIYAKLGRKVHVLVFNDYLAARDANENKVIYDFCGISVAYINEITSVSQRKSAYDADVLYVSAREAGYDSIRNFVAESPDELLGNYDVAIIDEADSILIDEASIPLVLAGNCEENNADILKLVDVAKNLEEDCYEKNDAEKSIWLTDKGIAILEEKFKIENLYDDLNSELLSGINTALQALYVLKKDQDYIVKDGKIAVIDESTGRIALNRKFPHFLQKYVEVKEGIIDNTNTRIFCTMTIGAFVKQYNKISGMTGTAATSANEFETTYQLRTVVMEPHTPCIRIDRPDEIFLTNEKRDKAVINAVVNANLVGQPVLIGTSSVEASEKLSKLLEQKSITHQVLNAKNNELEAKIIASAGAPYSVTVSTNMAGRGVDIKLGGANEEEKDFVSSVGGLFVIGCSINKSRRIDNQLKGRAGRQGDAGESKFYISLEDENIAPFFDEDVDINKASTEKEKATLVRNAQITLEGNNAEARYTLKKYSYIIEHQRKLITKYRNDLLLGLTVPNICKELDNDLYIELETKVGKKQLESAETALSLYYINHHFANYLEAMEEYKSGVHLTIVGGKNPFDEFNRNAILAFEEMNNDIRYDVLNKLRECKIDENGIDVESLNLKKNTGTWTYMVDDSSNQFSRLPELMNMVTKKIKQKLSFSEKLENFLNKKKNKSR